MAGLVTRVTYDADKAFDFTDANKRRAFQATQRACRHTADYQYRPLKIKGVTVLMEFMGSYMNGFVSGWESGS